MKLIVGLGNPGKEYERTRHNVGFMAIDLYCLKKDLAFKKKFNGLYTKDIINGEEIIFLKPQNFMNLSGKVVRQFIDYFKINIDDILIIYDDAAFEIGSFKIKPAGSDGGHNGVKDIISNIGTSNFKRIRIGISKSEQNMKAHVLSKFSESEINKINETLHTIIDVINDYSKLSFENLMNKYNR